jgi:hypothetical protein
MSTVKKTRAKAKPAPHKASKKAAPARKAVKKPAAKHTARTARAAVSAQESGYMKFSGKFTVRLPRSLHQALVDRAEREGVSLNLFVTNALSRTVAVPSGKKR